MLSKLFILIIFISANAFAVNLNSDDMKLNITTIGNAFKLGYAPTEWKSTHAGWDLNAEIEKAKLKTDDIASNSIYDYHKILSSFFKSARDYHVGVRFHSTLSSTLPFTVKPTETKNPQYFIAHVDTKKLSNSQYKMEVGDELISFNNKPVSEEIDVILSELANDVPLTDHLYSTLMLTRRRASQALTVPTGVVHIGLRKKGTKKIINMQLIWETKHEKLYLETNQPDHKPKLAFVASMGSSYEKLIKKNMALPKWMHLNDESPSSDSKEETNPYKPNENLHAIGGKKSFIPRLGTLIWESENTNAFDAYIYKNKAGKLVGYVRIYHYSQSDKEFDAFVKIIDKFEKITDGLVIDQVNNPGGSVFYLYALVSTLTDKPFYAPKHRIQIKQETIIETLDVLEKLEAVKDNESAQKVFGKTWDGYPVNYQVAEFAKQFGHFIISQWSMGKTLSDPVFLYAADRIMPHPKTNYTKPILLLTNSLDFSGGDFFPAILQDNKRVKILGTRTAGAGGFVEQFSLPNNLGVGSMSLTGSIALRIDQNPIENLGVTPDINYLISADDLENNYKNYVEKIQTEINNMIN